MHRHVVILLFILLLGTSPVFAAAVEVEVSSVKIDLALRYSPGNLLDGDPSTAWVGGGVSSGPGQWIELRFDYPTRVERLGIYNGHQGEGEFDTFRRIRSGRIVYPDGTESRFWLSDEPGEQVIHCLGTPVRSLRIVVDTVSPRIKETTFKGKLAVSGVRLYLSLMAAPGGHRKDLDALNKVSMHLSTDPDFMIPDEVVALLKEFYIRQTSLADDYAELFSNDVRDENDFRFEVFKEMQRQRGTYKILRTAQVDPSALEFEKVEEEGDYIRVRVFGSYRVQVAELDRQLEEDSVFVVAKGAEGWKIVELEEE